MIQVWESDERYTNLLLYELKQRTPIHIQPWACCTHTRQEFSASPSTQIEAQALTGTEESLQGSTDLDPGPLCTVSFTIQHLHNRMPTSSQKRCSQSCPNKLRVNDMARTFSVGFFTQLLPQQLPLMKDGGPCPNIITLTALIRGPTGTLLLCRETERYTAS